MDDDTFNMMIYLGLIVSATLTAGYVGFMATMAFLSIVLIKCDGGRLFCKLSSIFFENKNKV